jgi:hypothetical protein
MADNSAYKEPDTNLDGWDPQRALDCLSSERAINPDETDEEMAKRLFRENLGMAVMSICHTAQHSANEKVRLDAAKYVVERNLGRLQDAQPNAVVDPFEKLMQDLMRNDPANT